MDITYDVKSVPQEDSIIELGAAERTHVAGLKCEMRSDPLGVDSLIPRLSWRMESGRRGVRQRAYQVLVATELQLLTPDDADIWNSEKIQSEQSLHVEYDGPRLNSSQKVFWTVRVWESHNEEPTRWNNAATWTMGIVDSADWHG